MTLGRAMLADIPARPPLRDADTVLKHPDRLAPARRDHQFPFATSFNAAMWSVWSATIRFNLAFSVSSSFNHFTSSAFIPCCARHGPGRPAPSRPAAAIESPNFGRLRRCSCTLRHSALAASNLFPRSRERDAHNS